jgi:tetrahydromethanopterin S-methyltransferase subunit F
MNNIKNLSESIEYKTQLIGRTQRLKSGVEYSRIKGILLGFTLTLIIVAVPIIYYKGGF